MRLTQTRSAALLLSTMARLVGAGLDKLPPVAAGLTRVYLCRHGQTDWNAAAKIQGSVDIELNAVGRAQAAAIGAALEGVPLALVASSDLLRAASTADAVHAAQPAGTPRRLHAGLREMSFGDLEGTAPGDIYRDTNAAWAAGDLARSWPGGEGPRDVDGRARAALVDLGLLGRAPGPDPPPAHVCLVAHGRFNKIVLASLLGRGLGRSGELVQGNCCINVLDVDTSAAVGATDAATEVVLNHQDHLASLSRDEGGPT